jgi:Tol biopolymer transport system component/DNA-binding winged helix-turn-helix (wHTH) protein
MSAQVYEFGSFRLDPNRRLLYRQGEVVSLTPKVLETLLVLVENGGRAVDKEALIKAVWPDTFVEDGNLAQTVSTLRKVLGESPTDHAYIETIPKRGYRFVAFVTKSDAQCDLLPLRDVSQAPATNEKSAPAVATRKRKWISWPVVIASIVAASVGIGIGSLLLPRGEPDLSDYRYTPLVTNHRWQRYPSLSPDGKTLAYVGVAEGGSHLFTRRLDSATSVRLTSSLAGVYAPFWSRDSRRVFFHTLGPSSDLWSIAAGGGEPERFLENVMSAALTPDNRTLVIVRTRSGNRSTGGSSVWISSPPGTNPRPYEPTPFESVTGYDLPWMQCAPDGRNVLLAINRSGRQQEFWLLPIPPGPARRVLQHLPQAGVSFTPTFSWIPDSRHVVMALSTRRDEPPHLVMVDVAGHTWRSISTGPTNDGSMSVAPDGGRIVYTRNLSDYDLMEAPVTGGRVRELLATSRWEGMPAWGPVSQQFVFVTNRRGTMEIWLKSRAEGWERPLVTPQDFPDGPTRSFMGPVFSPDGKRIAYTRNSAAGTSIWITPIAGGVPARLTGGQTFECPPDWSPDGAWLAFVRSDPDKLRLVKVRLGSSDAPVVLTETEFHYVPQWSPTGEWITYAHRDGFGIISADGKQSRVLFKGRPSIMAAFWSKDGRTLYAVNYSAVLIAADIVAGREKIIGELDPGYPQSFPQSWIQPGIRLTLAPDGKTFAFGVLRRKEDIWLLEGFEPPSGRFGRLLRNLRLKN